MLNTPSYPNFIERHQGVVELTVRTSDLSPLTKALKFQGTKTITGTFADLATVPVSTQYRSPSLQRNKINMVAESNFGLTRFSFDPDDFAGTNFHGEGAINFIRVQELDSSGSDIRTGPLLVIPPPNFFATGRRTLVLIGAAASVSNPAGYSGLPPEGVTVIKLPKFSDATTITNTGTNPLMVALGAGHMEIQVPATESVRFNEGGISHLFLRGVGGATNFSAIMAIVNGIEA